MSDPEQSSTGRAKGACGAWALAMGAGLLAAGCFLMQSQPAPAAPAGDVLEPPDTPVRVTLLWYDPVDLDLYVTDPGLETVYFANSPSGSGGTLSRDVQCSEVQGDGGAAHRRESVVWEKPAGGRYRVGADFIDACEIGLKQVKFRVVVDAAGRRTEQAGVLDFERFVPVVVEFDLPEGSGGESAHRPSGSEAK